MSPESDSLANEILNLSRNKLLVHLRFMDVALSYHKRAAYEGSLATDGKTLFYDPLFVLKTYKDSQEEMVRAEDLGDYFRICADNRDLNYDKFFTKGNKKVEIAEEYDSHNTRRLDVEGMKELLLKLDLFQ